MDKIIKYIKTLAEKCGGGTADKGNKKRLGGKPKSRWSETPNSQEQP